MRTRHQQVIRHERCKNCSHSVQNPVKTLFRMAMRYGASTIKIIYYTQSLVESGATW